MEESCRCRALFLSVFRSVQAIKLFKESVCKKFFTPVHQFVDSPTYSFEQAGITFPAQPYISEYYCSQQGIGDINVDGNSIDDLTFLDALDPVDSAPYFPPPLTDIHDSGMYRTTVELTPIHQYQLPISTAETISNMEVGFHQPEESFYETVEDSSHIIEGTYSEILSANMPLLQQPARYGKDYETVSAFVPSPQHYNEGLATLSCSSFGSPAMLQSTFSMNDSMMSLLDLESLTNFDCPAIDYTTPHEFLEQGDYFQRAQSQYNCYLISQAPPTQARRIGCCVIANIVWMCKTFLSRIRSRMGLKRRYRLQVDDDYDGVQPRPTKSRRRNNWVVECRLCRSAHGNNHKVWLGSFLTKEQAARAYDVGRMFCSKKAKGFKFPASEAILYVLKHTIRNLPLLEKKKAIQEVAKEYSNTGCIDESTRKYCFETSTNPK